MPITSFALESLHESANGLLMPSETDAPFEPFFWQDEQMKELSPERVAELADVPKDAKIESVSVSSFFRDATKEEEWHNEEEAARVQKFVALVKAIKKTLDQSRVFRAGKTEVDCYIAGDVEGGENAPSGVGGLKTQVVET